MTRPLSYHEIEEARRVLAVQASTRPADGNIGPTGAWARAKDVQVEGRYVHERIGETPIFRASR